MIVLNVAQLYRHQTWWEHIRSFQRNTSVASPRRDWRKHWPPVGNTWHHSSLEFTMITGVLQHGVSCVSKLFSSQTITPLRLWRQSDVVATADVQFISDSTKTVQNKLKSLFSRRVRRQNKHLSVHTRKKTYLNLHTIKLATGKHNLPSFSIFNLG